MRTLLLAFACVPLAAAEKPVFEATFDGGFDAKTAKGDRRLYSAPSYKDQASAQPGLAAAEGFVEFAKGEGRKGGDAIRFLKKNTRAVFYLAKDNVPFDAKNWTGP